ncbi:hypothetical protein Tco_1436037, partial [Tanacetum coccineum]
IWYDEDVHDLRSVETEFPAIVFNDILTSNETLSYEPTVSSLNDNKIDFRISFDESDDEDYTVVFGKNLFSYKMISANDSKTDSENDNEKVYTPSFASPDPKVNCFDDLDFFKNFENEFPAIIYNDALTSKSNFLTEPTLKPQHIDEFDLKDETSLSEYNEVEQNVLYFNDLFPFNIIYPDDLKSGKDNDDNKINIIQSSGGNVNIQGQKKFLKASHDKINKIFNVESFIMKLNVNIVVWNYIVNEMLLNLIKNLYVPFGIPFDLKRYYKDGDYARMLWRPRIDSLHTAKEMAEDGFGAYWLGSERVIPDMGDLRGYWIEISSDREFLRPSPSYTYIKDPVRRLCHRLISYIISKRGQILEKVTATNIFYLRSMDQRAANISYLLALYLFRHSEGRKSGVRLSGGHFIGRLAHHFGLVSDDRLRGLSVVTRELPLIDMGELSSTSVWK